MSNDSLDNVRRQWTGLYTQTLPALARRRDRAQKKWPVTLDHCFARIILDNTIGRQDGTVVPWDTVISKPAVKNMDWMQLQAAIGLGEEISCGAVDLVELDQRSLAGREKGVRKYGKNTTPKRSREETEGLDEMNPTKKRKPEKRQSTIQFAPKDCVKPMQLSPPPEDDDQRTALLKKINTHPALTPYRKRLYTALLSVPKGHYTTYQALATHLRSSARAVGNGMRNNPFAPDVPCHRVLASDRSIGGFGGDWGKEGKHAAKKIALLKEEGVKFDSSGKVKGMIWDAFG